MSKSKKSEPPVGSDALLGLLESTAYNLWMSAIQSQSPNGQRLYRRMKDPQVGDMVMEITSYRRYGAVERMGYGKLIEVQDGDIITKKWTIETPFGKTIDWTNAMIIAIPGQEFDWYPPICQPNANMLAPAEIERNLS